MVTLDITESGIRILETEGDRIVSWASHSLNPGMFEDGMIADPDALGNTIKGLISSSGIKSKRITASISGLYSISRIIIVSAPPEIPVTEHQVLEAVAEALPLSDEEIYLSWHPIAVGEGGHQVLVHAIPRDMADYQMQALKHSGLSTRVLDLRTMALGRAVNREDALIFNIESESFDVVMVVDGLAEVMRTTAWQSEGLSTDEKAEYLVSSLNLTIDFYNTTRPGFPFSTSTPLLITGLMSGDLDLVEKIRAELEYPPAEISPPFDYPEHFSASQYAVNIGLALLGTDLQNPEVSGYLTPDMNLLPKAYLPWKPSPRQIYLSLAFFAAVAVLFPFYATLTEAMDETETLETQYKSVDSLLDLRKTELATLTPLQRTISEYETIVGYGGGLVEDIQTIEKIAGELGVTIDQINHLGVIITFNCQTNDYQVFRQFKTALEQSGRFLTPITPPEGYPYVKGGIIKLEPTQS